MAVLTRRCGELNATLRSIRLHRLSGFVGSCGRACRHCYCCGRGTRKLAGCTPKPAACVPEPAAFVPELAACVPEPAAS